jgi:hypothetical protein
MSNDLVFIAYYFNFYIIGARQLARGFQSQRKIKIERSTPPNL